MDFLNDPSTVFVLGAGSAADCGMPTATQLRGLIINYPLVSRTGLGGDPFFDEEDARDSAREFTSAFETSGQPSIDRFIELRREWHDMGCLQIAHALLSAQRDSIHSKKYLNSWTRWFYTDLLESPKDFSSIQCSFVTFNYDTMLQSSLAIMASHSHNLPIDNATRLARQLKVHHVYGGFDVYPTRGTSASSYEFQCGHQAAISNAKRIRLVDHRDSAAEALRPVQQVIANARLLVFMGFSYDVINMRRLGFDGVTSSPSRTLCIGTRLGLPEGRLDRVREQLPFDIDFVAPNMGCSELLQTRFKH